MENSYKTFFKLKIFHEYYLNRRSPDFQIVPTADCLKHFKKLNVQFRAIENGFVTFIQTNSQQEPFVNVPPEKYYRKDFKKVVFSFYVLLKNPSFLYFTNIASPPQKKYIFSNLTKNKIGDNLYLTNPVEEYSNNKDYEPGNLVRDARTNVVYEAIKKFTGKKKTDLTDATLWVPKGIPQLIKGVATIEKGKTYSAGDIVKGEGTENYFEAVVKHTSAGKTGLKDKQLWKDMGEGHWSYASVADAVDYSNGTFLFPLSKPANKIEVSIFEFNYTAEAEAFDVLVGSKIVQEFENPVSQVQVNLSHLKPGKYQVVINKESRFVYFDPGLSKSNTLGIIEIFNHLQGKDEFGLLTDDEKIKGVEYSIMFPARRVLWKYIRKDSKAKSVTDEGETGYTFTLAGDTFVSATPIPLSEGVLKTLKLSFNTSDFAIQPLPNPSVGSLSKCLQDDYEYLCSEMYLNY